MEDYKIVAMTDLAKYQRSARMGKIATVIAVVLVVVASFVIGKAIGKIEAYEETSYQLEKMQKENAETVQTFVLAWENQQKAIQLIEAWAQYVRGRQESIALNRGMGPIERPPTWPKRKGVDAWAKE